MHWLSESTRVHDQKLYMSSAKHVRSACPAGVASWDVAGSELLYSPPIPTPPKPTPNLFWAAHCAACGALLAPAAAIRLSFLFLHQHHLHALIHRLVEADQVQVPETELWPKAARQAWMLEVMALSSVVETHLARFQNGIFAISSDHAATSCPRTQRCRPFQTATKLERVALSTVVALAGIVFDRDEALLLRRHDLH